MENGLGAAAADCTVDAALTAHRVERRWHRRVRLDVQIGAVLIDMDASRVVRALLHMLGAGGAFVLVSAPFDVDNRLTIHFGLPTDPPSDILCDARVRYVIEGRGVGIQFLDLDPEQRADLKSFVHGKLSDATAIAWDDPDAVALQDMTVVDSSVLSP